MDDREKIFNEIVETERKYLASLDLLNKVCATTIIIKQEESLSEKKLCVCVQNKRDHTNAILLCTSYDLIYDDLLFIVLF